MIQNGKRNMNLQFGTAQHEMVVDSEELCCFYIPTGIFEKNIFCYNKVFQFCFWFTVVYMEAIMINLTFKFYDN